MQPFMLMGFAQEDGYRLFSFDRTGSDGKRMHYTVRADLALVLKYGIQIQNLPLLCRGLLERHDEIGAPENLTFAEEDMRECARERDAAREQAAKKKKSWHRSGTENLRAGAVGEPAAEDAEPF